MKKSVCKLIAILLAAALMCSLAACGEADKPVTTTNGKPTETQANPTNSTTTPPAVDQTDWTAYTDWVTTDWDSKTVRYQFIGSWDLPEYGFFYTILVNLYDDGSVLVDQRNTASASSYQQFGYWSEEETEDGNEISLDTLYCTPVTPGDELVAHEYHYDLYEESDGNYSFGYTFGIAPGAYFRTADMTGSPNVTYATVEDFHTAVDRIVEVYRFANTTTSMEGFTAVISVLSNNTVSAQLMTEYQGSVVCAHEDTGVLAIEADESGNVTYKLVIADVEIPVTVNEDGSFADFEWTCNWANQGITVDFTMAQTEVVVEEAAE